MAHPSLPLKSPLSTFRVESPPAPEGTVGRCSPFILQHDGKAEIMASFVWLT